MSLKTAPTVEMVDRMYISRQERGEDPPIAWVQLKGQPMVTSLSDILQQEQKEMIFFSLKM